MNVGLVLGICLLVFFLYYAFKSSPKTNGGQVEQPSAPQPYQEPSMPHPPVEVKVPEGVYLDFFHIDRKYPIRSSPIVIGRGQNCTVRVDPDNLKISRRHAEIRFEDGSWHVIDAGSSNGLFVNGSRVSSRVLRASDVISLGGFEFRFEMPGTQVRSHDAPGARSGQITLLEEVGRGGEAVVYKAQRAGDTAYIALKLPSADMNDREAARRLQNEIKVAKSLEHRHLVTVVDSGQWQDGRPFMAMEFCSGGSLRKRMQPDLGLDTLITKGVGIQAVDGLAHMHARGYIHRDTKPENVLIAGSNTIKLGDFGIAARIGDHGDGQGTPHYMSPEQIRGDVLTASSDLYSVGCLLYEMRIGRCPFEGYGDEIKKSHVSMNPEPLNSRHPDVSPDLNSLVMQLLDKDPERRPGSLETIQRLQLL